MIQKTYGTIYYVDNMAEAVSFYKRNLGLNPTYESEGWTEFAIGGHNLCLHAKAEGETNSGNGVLILRYDGIKDLHAKMKGDGLNINQLHEVHPGAWTFHLKDKSGNELSFYGKP